jgi:predicted RNA-binding Zn ribbon-like protein
MRMSNDLVGNALCLDFANTVNRRPNPTRDTLAGADALMRWATAAGLELDATPDEVDAALPWLRDLREAIYAVFAAIACGEDPPEEAMRPIITTYADGLPRADWRREASRLAPTIHDAGSPGGLAWRVSVSAVDLLRTGPLDRIGRCPSCRWVFLDTSRNGRRRWCDMATCGSRSKSARYAERSRRTA